MRFGRRRQWHDWEGAGGQWHRQHHRGSYLRRRIFWAMATAVALTAIVTPAMFMAMGGYTQTGWARQVEQGRSGLSRQLARVWDNPAARDALVLDAARDFRVEVTLRDNAGARLLVVGGGCSHPFLVPVERDGAPLGVAEICMPHAAWGVERGIIAMLFVVAVFWAVSGRTARRIARPLDELAQVARRLGTGDLKARAGASCRVPGEIGEVADAVNDMAARIQKQLDDQKELLAAVSHEMRTPLARIRLVAELARDGGATPKTFDDLDREVEEMDSLVGQLLASSRLDFGTLSVKTVPAADQGLRALERAGLTPDKLAVEGVQDVKADPTLLARALGNLLDNAKRHGGGLEQLLIRHESGRVVFEAHDKGPGFKDGGANAFEAFRPEAGGGRADGLGLGLGLVRRIAQAHGGDANAKNKDGGGAVVSFWLPA